MSNKCCHIFIRLVGTARLGLSFRLRRLLVGAVLASCFAGPIMAQTRAPLVIVANSDTRSQVSARLFAQVIKDAGFNVAFSAVAASDLSSALASGRVHAVPEVAFTNPSQSLVSLIDNGQIVDLGFRQAGVDDPPYKKLAWARAVKDWAGAIKILKNMTMPEADMLAMVAAVDKDNQKVDAVVSQWLQSHPRRWAKWKSVSKNWMKP